MESMRSQEESESEIGYILGDDSASSKVNILKQKPLENVDSFC
jgi:hypothetical protein